MQITGRLRIELLDAGAAPRVFTVHATGEQVEIHFDSTLALLRCYRDLAGRMPAPVVGAAPAPPIYVFLHGNLIAAIEARGAVRVEWGSLIYAVLASAFGNR